MLSKMVPLSQFRISPTYACIYTYIHIYLSIRTYSSIRIYYLLEIIGDEDVVEDGPVVDHPELEAQHGRLVRRELHALLVVGVGDRRSLPLALVPENQKSGKG